MGRHIGARIKQAVAIVQEIGPCTYAQVWARMDVTRSGAHQYCKRAVGHGLLKTDKSVFPQLYYLPDKPPAPKPKVKPLPKVIEPQRPRINSVFALGSL